MRLIASFLAFACSATSDGGLAGSGGRSTSDGALAGSKVLPTSVGASVGASAWYAGLRRASGLAAAGLAASGLATVGLVAAGLVVAAPAHGAAAPLSAHATPAPAVPVTVARYSFDTGTVTGGRIADRSGRGAALTVRTAAGGRMSFNGTTADKYAAFPAPCTAKAGSCARALLEGTDDPGLDPLTRTFRWGATVRVTKAQLSGSANIVQKGVADTDSQWKLQLGADRGRAHCVVVGQGGAKATIHLVRSSAGIADGAWHEVMCERSGSRLAVYVDGKERGSRAIPAGLSIANSLPLRVGGPNFAPTSDMYHGLLDDVYARLG